MEDRLNLTVKGHLNTHTHQSGAPVKVDRWFFILKETHFYMDPALLYMFSFALLGTLSHDEREPCLFVLCVFLPLQASKWQLTRLAWREKASGS